MSVMGMLRQLSIHSVAFEAHSWDNQDMQDDDKKHPGPWRVMRVDSGFAALIVSAGFLWLFLAGMPLGKWFLLGTVLVAAVVALVLRFTSRQ